MSQVHIYRAIRKPISDRRYERFAWIPIFISIVIAIGCGGKHLSEQVAQPPASASTVLSFGGLIAGFIIPYGTLASDYATYMRPDAPG